MQLVTKFGLATVPIVGLVAVAMWPAASAPKREEPVPKRSAHASAPLPLVGAKAPAVQRQRSAVQSGPPRSINAATPDERHQQALDAFANLREARAARRDHAVYGPIDAMTDITDAERSALYEIGTEYVRDLQQEALSLQLARDPKSGKLTAVGAPPQGDSAWDRRRAAEVDVLGIDRAEQLEAARVAALADDAGTGALAEDALTALRAALPQ